jgi:hypothetical protein
MSHLCNRCVRELLILARTWFAFGLPSKPGVTEGQSSLSASLVAVSKSNRSEPTLFFLLSSS